MNENTENMIETDCEEQSFCNCENSETITPYLRDDCDCFDEAAEAVAEKCHEMQDVCEEKAEVAVKTLKKQIQNPYLKHSCSMQTDVYKSIHDETPADTLKMEQAYACSLRTLALIGGAVLVMILVKRMLDKRNFD